MLFVIIKNREIQWFLHFDNQYSLASTLHQALDRDKEMEPQEGTRFSRAGGSLEPPNPG